MKRFFPDSVAGRTLFVLLVGLMASHLASMAVYSKEGHEALRLLSDRLVAERMAIITRLLDDTPPPDRPRILETVNGPGVRVAWASAGAAAEGAAEGDRLPLIEHLLKLYLGGRGDGEVRVSYADREAADPPASFPAIANGGFADHSPAMRRYLQDIAAHADASKTVRTSIQLSDSTWLDFSAPLHVPTPFLSLRFILSMSIMLLGVAALSVWVVRRSIAPLTTFARAAERLGVDVDAPRLPEAGPREIRQATRAFNEMQGRIHRFVEDRTQMVAAIAHDLGTPITRLRLRAEYVEDEEQRHKVLADLHEMEKMIASTVSFARDDGANEPRQTFDLVSLMQSISDDMTDAGQSVEFRAAGRLPYDCRPVALRRAFTNLIENAVKFGRRARVSVTRIRGAARPGAPDWG
jgi:signal transduction histidine kinase